MPATVCHGHEISLAAVLGAWESAATRHHCGAAFRERVAIDLSEAWHLGLNGIPNCDVDSLGFQLDCLMSSYPRGFFHAYEEEGQATFFAFAVLNWLDSFCPEDDEKPYLIDTYMEFARAEIDAAFHRLWIGLPTDKQVAWDDSLRPLPGQLYLRIKSDLEYWRHCRIFPALRVEIPNHRIKISHESLQQLAVPHYRPVVSGFQTVDEQFLFDLQQWFGALGVAIQNAILIGTLEPIASNAAFWGLLDVGSSITEPLPMPVLSVSRSK